MSNLSEPSAPKSKPKNQVVISQDHSWFKRNSLTVTIENGRISDYQWTSPPHDMLENLKWMFSFTAFGPDSMTIQRVSGDAKVSVSDLFKMLHELPVKEPLKIAFKSICGCNMGTCDEPIGIDSPQEMKTMGQFFEYIGDEAESKDGIKFYEHPDQVALSLEMAPREIWVYEGRSCYSDTKKRVKIPPGTILASYGR